MRRAFASLALTVGAALLPAAALSEESAASPVTRTSRPVRLLRTWQETIKGAAGREYLRRVELVFDYEKGVARELYYTAEGRPWGGREIKQRQPQPSAEEIAEAKELILRDRDLARIVGRRSAEFNGGFLLEEARGLPCGPGSRCVQLQLLTPDHSGLLRWTVVDLVQQRVAYPVYVPKGVRR
jgi:hypothetical protein